MGPIDSAFLEEVWGVQVAFKQGRKLKQPWPSPETNKWAFWAETKIHVCEIGGALLPPSQIWGY